MSPLRPPDADAAKAELRRLRSETDLPVVFAGECDGTTLVLRHFIGTRTRAMDNLSVASGAGLGGRVMAIGRPTTVEDYARSQRITQDYAHVVGSEGLRAMVAVPVVVDGRPRAVLYGAARVRTQLGEQVKDRVVAAAARLRTEIAVRDEVDRRLRLCAVASAERGHGFEQRDREQLRVLHGELRAIASLVDDPDLRARLHSAGEALASVGRPRPESDPRHTPLSPREVDVLAQVALGCSNAEVAARLSLSCETVKAYLRTIGSKLESSSRMESVARARLLGVLP